MPAGVESLQQYNILHCLDEPKPPVSVCRDFGQEGKHGRVGVRAYRWERNSPDRLLCANLVKGGRQGSDVRNTFFCFFDKTCLTRLL